MTLRFLRAACAAALLWPLAAAAIDDRVSLSQATPGTVRPAIWRVEASCIDEVGEVELLRPAPGALELRALPQPACAAPAATSYWTRHPSLTWHGPIKLPDGDYTFTWSRTVTLPGGKAGKLAVRRAFALQGGRLVTPAHEHFKAWYRTLAGREADGGGLAYWTSVHETLALAGATPQDALRMVAIAFAQSPEVVARAGTDADWVDKLFRAFLGRDSDPEARVYWARRVQSAGRLGVARALLQSPEGAARLAGAPGTAPVARPEVADALAIFDGLAPGAADLAEMNRRITRFMASACVGGDSPDYVLAYREAVREMAAQVPASLPPKDRVAGLYEAIFGRAPDEPGGAYWSGRLERGEATWMQVAETMLTLPDVEPLLRRKAAAYCAPLTPR